MNAVGPVTLIALGIYLGYLTITGRAANFAAFLASGGQSVTPATSTATTTPAAGLSTVAGSSSTGVGAAQSGSIMGILPAGAIGTAAGMSAQQAANAAAQIPYTIDFAGNGS